LAGFHLYLPQMRMSHDSIVERARTAEAAGFEGIALMDHMAPPRATDQPMFEALTTATWIAAHTERLRVGHIVLCDSFRGPALLAKEAVTLDHASGGRFELGIGWGSNPRELGAFGMGSEAPRDRVRRLAETLQVLELLWSGEVVDFEGEHHRLAGAQQLPRPLGEIPLTIGGAGPATLRLVERHATWWNVPARELGRIGKLRPRAGSARVSALMMVGLIRSEDEREEVVGTVGRRFGAMMGDSLVVGDAAQVSARLSELEALQVERFYLWFADFAKAASLAAFGEVIGARRASAGGP
jgi:alkanesulfonate monooxygenase SsuD/methylene tetrahydromethanopterin reductase-like flavin-dependent oxidoreductase (luciferase family)